MPEENKKVEEMVDIDNSGPEIEVNIEETKENENNETINNDNKSDGTLSKSDEQLDIRVGEDDKEPVAEKKEETKKEELEQYSDGVQKRIAKLTKKWREAERQREAALEYAKGVQDEHSKLKTKVSNLEPSYVNAMEGRVVSGLQAAQAKLVAAREAGDIKSEVEAQKEIGKLGVEESRVAAFKTRVEETREREVKTPTLDQAVGRPPAPDPRAESWAEKNDWFGKDNAMTYTAFDLHRKLTEEEGFDPKSDSYYKEIDKRIRLEFPQKFGNTVEKTINKPTQNVASATRSARVGRKSVKLTPSQVAIAKKLRVPLEEYARQLKLTEGE